MEKWNRPSEKPGLSFLERIDCIMDEQLIWTELSNFFNVYGVAGLMGNLFAESSLSPLCVTGKNGLSGKQYAEDVDSGKIGVDEFAHDGIAFGLAQWRYWSRKEQLYYFARDVKKASIGSLDVQLAFLIKELQTYRTVWATLCSAESVKEASDIVLLRYEKPANTSDKAKEKRAAFGKGYFDKYALKNIPTEESRERRVRTTARAVNLRRGNGKSYESVGLAHAAGTEYPWIATAENGWHAVEATVNHKKLVVWISGDFSEVV